VIWERSLSEDFGLLTTHGGRTVSPIIDGDLVYMSGITFGWGPHARGAHRFMAFDKRTGETYLDQRDPGWSALRHYYAPPIIANINGTRLLTSGRQRRVCLCDETSDLVNTVWKYEISKRWHQYRRGRSRHDRHSDAQRRKPRVQRNRE
jgi:hypothetical protein